MKVLLNRKPVEGPWGGGNQFVRAFFEFAPKFGVTPVTSFGNRPDVALMIDPRYDEMHISANEIQAYKRLARNFKVVHRINECDARKGTSDMDPMLLDCSSWIDHTVFVSGWTQGYFEARGWKCPKKTVVYNGVDKSVFSPAEKKAVGPIMTKTRLVTHHWSDNALKGQDAHEWLDNFVQENPEFTYTYVGRSKYVFKNSKHVQPLSGVALGEELRKHDVYISATYADPGPNHIIEALASGLSTYVWIAGGGAVEFAGQDHTFEDLDGLKNLLLAKKFESNTSWSPLDWESCIKSYVDVIKETVNG